MAVLPVSPASTGVGHGVPMHGGLEPAEYRESCIATRRRRVPALQARREGGCGRDRIAGMEPEHSPRVHTYSLSKWETLLRLATSLLAITLRAGLGTASRADKKFPADQQAKVEAVRRQEGFTT